MKYFLISVWFLLSSLIANAQSFYYVIQDINNNAFLGIYNVNTCQDSIVLQINTTGFNSLNFKDIAICPDGEIYLYASANDVNKRYIFKLNVSNLNLDIINIPPNAKSSMTCNSNHVLYLAGNGLYSYNLTTGVGVDHGPLSNVSEITF